MNGLAGEKSPYLLQHADNPVDWRPWGEEAFDAARRENKPVFLSIGYSTCHWCHVMERESFRDEETARLLNRAFVCVKVDREERPDLDHYYMTVCQLLTGSGGWPLTLILTPEKKPFFAATYIPRESRHGRLGLKELVPRLQAAWETNREGINASAERITDVEMRLSSPEDAPGASSPDLAGAAYRSLKASFDAEWGGFGTPPKFPVPHGIVFLLRHGRRTDRTDALAMAERTLEAMSRGGIFDHLGGGFHRYATDREWLVPHFEKMLYDQALLALAYAEGWMATGRPAFRSTAERVVEYMIRDLRMPGGGFASAEDADSEGEEGKYYLWTSGEILNALGPGEAEEAAVHFHVRAEGNFREPGKEPDGRNILHLGRRPGRGTDIAEEDGTSVPEERMAAIRARLLAVRERRTRPLQDTKVLTDWNGLALAALSVCGRELGRPAYLREAERLADFLGSQMGRPDGGLYHRFKDGEAAIPGFVDDYAFVIWGLIELHQSTFRAKDLAAAVRLTGRAIEDFWDVGGGGFFFSAEARDEFPPRRKEFADGALPSGNSVMAGNLLLLARLTARSDWEEMFVRASRLPASTAAPAPSSLTHVLAVAELAREPFYETIITGRKGAADTEALLDALRKACVPWKTVLLRPEGPEAAPLLEVAPFLEPYRSLDGRAAAYVCAGRRCFAPVTTPEAMLALIGQSAV